MVQPYAILFFSSVAFILIGFIAIYMRKKHLKPGRAGASPETDEETVNYEKVKNELIDNTTISEKDFETNVRGIFIAGELRGMNTLNNAAQQAGNAVGYIAGKIDRSHKSDYDLIIIGAGPAGISAALAAKLNNLKFILLEQDTLAGSITSNPKKKVLVNGDINLPLAGRMKLHGSEKSDLIKLFHKVIIKYGIPVQENCRAESIIKLNNSFNVISSDLQNFTTAAILLAIGKRGSPRKLNIPGEYKEKVAYSISDIDSIKGERILIVGNNEQSAESALVLAGRNDVTIACRQNTFSGLTPLTGKLIDKAATLGNIRILYSSRAVLIEENHVILSTPGGYMKLYNDLVFVLHDGDSAENFLEKAGIGTAGVFVEEFHCQ